MILYSGSHECYTSSVRPIEPILAQRGLPMSDDQRRRIQACTDLGTLDGWLDRALLVTSVDELLG